MGRIYNILWFLEHRERLREPPEFVKHFLSLAVDFDEKPTHYDNAEMYLNNFESSRLTTPPRPEDKGGTREKPQEKAKFIPFDRFESRCRMLDGVYLSFSITQMLIDYCCAPLCLGFAKRKHQTSIEINGLKQKIYEKRKGE